MVISTKHVLLFVVLTFPWSATSQQMRIRNETSVIAVITSEGELRTPNSTVPVQLGKTFFSSERNSRITLNANRISENDNQVAELFYSGEVRTIDGRLIGLVESNGRVTRHGSVLFTAHGYSGSARQFQFLALFLCFFF